MSQFRIKEVALRADGTDIWFYPQMKITKKLKKGFLWAKKEVEIITWEVFYLEAKTKNVHFESSIDKYFTDRKIGFDPNYDIVAFRNLLETQEWIKKYDIFLEQEALKFKELREKHYKNIGGQIDTDKIYEVGS